MVKTPQTLSELLLTYSSKMFVTSLKRYCWCLVLILHLRHSFLAFGKFHVCSLIYVFLLCILLGVKHLVTLSVKGAL